MIKYIAFDADDTLWENEPYFRETETAFISMLAPNSDYSETELKELLYHYIVNNVPLYGYGTRSLMLSLMGFCNQYATKHLSEMIEQTIALGHEQLKKKVVLLAQVKETLHKLSKNYQLLLITKGDLMEQNRKIAESGLVSYFKYIRVLEEKDNESYQSFFNEVGVDVKELVMVGNSYKSDVLPVEEIGGHAIFIPYKSTWAFEHADKKDSDRIFERGSISEVPVLITSIEQQNSCVSPSL
ncbi:HAD family hydrolase [Halosquirtibacter xylanolyticus]|uniref:HAD family hydrolase n=1 Tax=Halosquirtibacter xylanolyticus TaxID=3374599 RepID=UPI0037488D95|nr:HAD family hydrolase [Prolixibacteraceae bacterium]